MKRSWTSFLVTPLLAAVLVLVWGVGSIGTAWGWTTDIECKDGVVGGTIHVPVESEFHIYVMDHKPGEADFTKVVGSEQNLKVVEDKVGFVHYGPLSLVQVRPGVDLILVEQDETFERSRSIPPCFAPTPTATSTSTSTNTPTATSTTSPTLTPTPTVTPITPTPTNTPVTPTSTPVAPSVTATRVLQITATQVVPTGTPHIELPKTGDGGDQDQSKGVSKTAAIVQVVLIIVVAVGLLTLLAANWNKIRPTN